MYRCINTMISTDACANIRDDRQHDNSYVQCPRQLGSVTLCLVMPHTRLHPTDQVTAAMATGS